MTAIDPVKLSISLKFGIILRINVKFKIQQDTSNFEIGMIVLVQDKADSTCKCNTLKVE